MDCKEKSSQARNDLKTQVAIALLLLIFLCFLSFLFKPNTNHSNPAPENIPADALPPIPLPNIDEPIDLLNPSSPDLEEIKPVATPPKLSNAAHTPTEIQIQTIVIKKNQTLIDIFENFHLSSQEAKTLLSLKKKENPLKSLKAGQKITMRYNTLNQFLGLELPISVKETLIVKSVHGHYEFNIDEVPVESHFHFAQTTVKKSFYEAGHRIGLSEKLLSQLLEGFSYDIDFAKELQAGDKFTLLYKTDYIGKKRVGGDELIAAAYMASNKTVKIIRYTDPKGQTEFYTPEGLSIKKAFNKSPVKYSRISSVYSSARYHPILSKIRAHRGIDYAAPYGTPIKATGSGKIIMASRYGGYGNVVMIKHSVKYTTVYGHLSRFAKGIRPGVPVKQDQIIGYIGTTGLATGPHCHYEFRVFGNTINPMSVQIPRSAPIPRKYRQDFKRKTAIALAELDTAVEHNLLAKKSNNHKKNQRQTKIATKKPVHSEIKPTGMA